VILFLNSYFDLQETAVKTAPTKYEGGLRRLIFNLRRQVL
jgi:hypothetical protein